MIINESKLKCIELAIQAKSASPGGTVSILQLARDFHDYCFSDYIQAVDQSSRLQNIENLLQVINLQENKQTESSLLIQQNQENMAQELEDLKAKVQQNGDVTQSAITLLQGLKTQLDTAIASGDPAALQALSDQLGAQDTALADAVTANTPAAGGGTTGGETGGTTGDTGTGDTGGGTAGDTGTGGGTTEPATA